MRRLHLSADGDEPRLYLQTARQAHPDGPLGPFFRRLCEELVGARLKRIETVARDRIVALEFDATSSGERRTLIAELVGRHSNLVLLGTSERVLEVLVAPPPDSKNGERLRSGAAWQVPGGTVRASDESPPLAEVLSAVTESSEARADPQAPLSFRVQQGLGRAVAQFAHARALRELEERIDRKLKRARSLEHGLVQKLAAAHEAERVRLDGEILKMNLPALRRGMREITLADPYAEDGASRTIELDPRRAPHENVELVFERYKKLLRAAETVERELAGCREKLASLEELARAAREPDSDPQAIDARGVALGVLDPIQESDPRKRKLDEPRRPYRVFRGLHGAEIRVGRSAKDNDELTLHHSKGSDVWLHTADTPGSHVVLCVEKNAEPDAEDLLDAAHLAVHFSPLRESRKANVHVARRKEVHKPRGAKPGLVSLSGGKTLGVRMQPERLARLLGSHLGPATSN
ncbi:MAG: DUF814 domain-containing protein [Planctomycetes bacterium]|nr:DUF814 domain-containing protein [Planctomycetota bacterium]